MAEYIANFEFNRNSLELNSSIENNPLQANLYVDVKPYIVGATASVSNTIGVPSCVVTVGGTPMSRTFDFAFENLKGADGVYIGTTPPTDEYTKIWLNPEGTQGKISDLIDDTSTNPVDKADTLTGLTASISELNYTDGVTSNIQTQLNAKQDTISDLSTIRSNAQAGAGAATTISSYGNIVTHNVSEFATSAQGSLANTAVQPSDLATVATSGSYNDLLNKPTIPTVNNATLTIQKNNTDVATFTANASSNVTANITVPTDTGDLTNNAGFIKGIDSTDVTTALGYTPYNSSNPDGYISGITSTDVTNALGYTPYNSSNPNGYTSNIGTVTSVNNVQPVNGNVSITIPDISNMQTTTNLVTSVSSLSTDSQYPSAKLFYDTCGDIETLINAL